MGVYLFCRFMHGNNSSILAMGHAHDVISDKVEIGGCAAFGLPYRLENFIPLRVSIRIDFF